MPLITIQYDTSSFAFPHVPLPDVWTFRKKFQDTAITDLETQVNDAVDRILEHSSLIPGATIAVGVGSRGIANLQQVVRSVVSKLVAGGYQPYIVPAMGSHGGATAEGQVAILADYGITEATIGVPVKATMEVDQIASLDDGYPVYLDQNAAHADGILVINRIKHHTDFVGPIQSGICKILAIGLGKQKGANSIHRFGATGLANTMPKVGRAIVQNAPVIGGVAIIENQIGQTMEIHSLIPNEIGSDKETQLLQRAIEFSPSLPVNNVDVLVVDEMGKNISGSGMDTHVIGRLEMPSVKEGNWTDSQIKVVCCMDITPESHGNAAGFGLADMIPRQFLEKIDFAATMTNHRTSGEGGVRRSKFPVVLENAEECVRAAIGGCGTGNYADVRLLRIKNTAFTSTFQVSEAIYNEIESDSAFELVSGPEKLRLQTRF